MKTTPRVYELGEVFTSETAVNDILDLLPNDAWHDPTTTFLEPACGDGNFLVEILRRKLASCDTPAAALAALGSIYAVDISTENIVGGTLGQWEGARGRLLDLLQSVAGPLPAPVRDAARRVVDQNIIVGDTLNGAVRNLPRVRFDVIVGNPPYSQATVNGHVAPIYQHFVTRAIRLAPKYITMVIPSRWMVGGGRGLKGFRERMLGDKRMRTLVHHYRAEDIFPTIHMSGGVAFFLWDSDHRGMCTTTLRPPHSGTIGPVARHLDPYDILVLDHRALPIIDRVLTHRETPLVRLIKGSGAFGHALDSNFTGYTEHWEPGSIKLYMPVGRPSSARREVWVSPEHITKQLDLVAAWKVFIKTTSNKPTGKPQPITRPAFVGAPQSACSEAYLPIGPFDTEQQAQSVVSYLRTRFVRFLVLQRKPAQHVARHNFWWVPQQTWDREWTDDELYDKYNITAPEREYIATIVSSF